MFFVWELCRPLLGSVPLYIIPDSVIYSPPELIAYLNRHCITRMLFTPSLLALVMEDPAAVSLTTLRRVWICGEVLTRELLAKCEALLPQVAWMNLYSVSECHDVSCVAVTTRPDIEATVKDTVRTRHLDRVDDEDVLRTDPGK